MSEFINTPLFGILLSIIAFEIGVWINKKTKISLLNPMLIGIVLVIGFLLVCNVKYESYKLGGDYISFFLAPATVALAVPLYKQLDKLKANWLPILVGIFVGSVSSIISVIVLAKFAGISQNVLVSITPKSITIPMGIEVSRLLGGLPAITVASIMITGITGAIISPIVCKLCHITDPVAQGVATGTASHAVGTSRMMELGEIQGAMSSLSIGIAGIVTAITAPIIVPLFL